MGLILNPGVYSSNLLTSSMASGSVRGRKTCSIHHRKMRVNASVQCWTELLVLGGLDTVVSRVVRVESQAKAPPPKNQLFISVASQGGIHCITPPPPWATGT